MRYDLPRHICSTLLLKFTVPSGKIIVRTAQELRQEAIDRLNADISNDSPHFENCCHATEDITIRPQKDLWWLVGVVLLGTGLITNQMLINDSSVLLRLVVLSPMLLLSITCLSSLFLRPVEIYFCKSSRKMAVIYRAGWLFKKPEMYEFDELESIQSIFKVTGDNDPSVSLELILNERKRLSLKTASPDWSPTSPPLGFSGCLEPKEIENLRKQIAKLTGTKDLGFLH